MRTTPIAALAAAVAVSASLAAQAEPIERTAFVNATGACNGSLPSFEGNLRKRPTAIANESSTPAFVGCSMVGDERNYGTGGVLAYFVNRGAAPVTVSCTYVDGVAQEVSGQEAIYRTGSVTVAPGAADQIVWNATTAAFSSFVNLNCALPPQVEIATIGYGYAEDNAPPAPPAP